MIEKVTAILLALIITLGGLNLAFVSIQAQGNETNTTSDPVLGNENTTTPDCLTEPCDPATGLPVEPATNVTSSVNQTITNETTVETNTTIPIANVTEPPPANITLPGGNETTQPPANVTVPPLEETLPPGNVSQSEPTAIQIQLIPNIQRGHNQHLTLFLVDDVGSVVPDEQMQANITNARGNLVGLKSFTTESGTEQTYKVGPNTSPQNITVFAQLPDTNITAQEEYSVFAKITAPTKPNNTQTEPEPLPPANVTGGNVTAPPVNSTITPPANATISFDKLENSTAILEQEIAQGDENGNETDRAEVKGAVSETLTSLGAVASEVATATNFQLGTIGSTAEAVADAIDQILT